MEAPPAASVNIIEPPAIQPVFNPPSKNFYFIFVLMHLFYVFYMTKLKWTLCLTENLMRVKDYYNYFTFFQPFFQPFCWSALLYIKNSKIFFSNFPELVGNTKPYINQKPLPVDPEFKAQHPGAYNNGHHHWKRDTEKG